MSHGTESLDDLNGYLMELAEEGDPFLIPTAGRARIRVYNVEPFVRGKEYNLCHDAPSLGECAIVGFSNTGFYKDEFFTGIAQVLPETRYRDLVVPGLYGGFKATPEHVELAAAFVVSRMGLVVPEPRQFAEEEPLVLPAPRQAAAERFAISA